MCPVCCERLTKNHEQSNISENIKEADTKQHPIKKRKKKTKQSSVFENVIKKHGNNKNHFVISFIVVFLVVIMIVCTLLGSFIWTEYNRSHFGLNLILPNPFGQYK